MKRTFFTATILICLASLFGATSHLSNSIGQDRGIWEGEGSFRLLILPSQKQLYGPEGLVWTKQVFDQENRQVEVTRYADGSPDHMDVFQDGLLLQQQEGPSITYYHYGQDGLLSQVTTLVDGALKSVRLYGYANGSLASILSIAEAQSELRTFGMIKDLAYFAFSDDKGGQLFTTLANGRTIGEYWIGEEKQQEVSVKTYEDGSFTIVRKTGQTEVQEHYDGRALLVSSKTPSYLVEYRYNEERVLIEERITQVDGNVIVKTYEQGNLVLVAEEKEGRRVKTTRYNEDGSSMQTLYSEGNKYADVTYAVDGKRILSIVYY